MPGYLGLGYVLDPADLGYVALAAYPADHLPDIAHRPALQGEVGDADDGLVAELERGQVAFPAPGLGSQLAAADDGRHPRMPGRLVQERVDGTGPRFWVADRVAARQHHAGQDAVADAGLAGRRPDDAFVIPQREVAERVLVTVPLQQLPDALCIRGAELAGGLGRPQEHEQGEEQRKQAEPAHHEAEVVVPLLGDEARRPEKPARFAMTE